MVKILTALIALSLLCWTTVRAADGAALYAEHCSVCHDSEGEGGIGLPLTKAMLAQASDQYLQETIRVGRPGRIMPAFDQLGGEETLAIVGYLRSWHGEAGPSYTAEAVEGDPQQGKQLFGQFCASCHGSGADGGSGTGVTFSRERSFLIMPPALNNPGFLQAAPDAMIMRIIEEGRSWAGMPAFGPMLSEQQRKHLVAFIRSLQGRPESDHEPVSSVMAYTLESPHDFDTTVQNIRQALAGSNFRIFPDRFLEQGLVDEFSHNTRQIQLRFCNFKELYDLLNIEPRLGVILPCAITVMEREDGSVLMVAPNMRAQAHLFNNEQLERLAGVMEGVILEVMEEASF